MVNLYVGKAEFITRVILLRDLLTCQMSTLPTPFALLKIAELHHNHVCLRRSLSVVLSSVGRCQLSLSVGRVPCVSLVARRSLVVGLALLLFSIRLDLGVAIACVDQLRMDAANRLAWLLLRIQSHYS